MNIAVITPFDSANYGAYLQAYCLKSVLESMGHTVYHIKTRSDKYVQNLYYRDFPIYKKEKYIPGEFKKRVNLGKEKFRIFQSEHAVFDVISPQDAKKFGIDLCILGSDEIWNINHPVFRQPLFWGAGFDRVVAYAPSIATANPESFKKYPELINALKKMSSILVRDKSTADTVHTLSGKTPELVCDPTLLLPADSYSKTISDCYIDNNDFLLVYAYNVSKKLRKYIKSYAKKHGLKTVSCCFYHDWCDCQCKCSPLEFYSLIGKSKAYVTTTFHGTVFGILNHANFVSVTQNPKTVNLLSQFNLKNRLVGENDLQPNTIENILSAPIDCYDRVDAKILELRSRSLELLKNAIDNAVKQDIPFDYQICPSDKCTGCFACMNKCPKDAVSSVIDYAGRTIPFINSDKCIKCGACKKVCPQNKPLNLNKIQSCYAAQRPDENVRKQSSSGGIGAVMSEYIIQNGGVVFGSAVNEKCNVVHTKAENLKQAEQFKRSKYVQSYIGYSFREVKAELLSGKTVLFTGTPCQTDGLKNYLGKDYENLFCVDLICHGVPPYEYLKQHLDVISKGQHCDSLTFRGGNNDFVLTLKNGDDVVYSKPSTTDVYFRSFIKSLSCRENCYNCPYAASQRSSDITVGDFFGLDRSTLQTKQSGNISVILVNTEKGKQFFEKIKDLLVFEPREISEAVKGNPHLIRPPKPHPKRKAFLELYIKTQDFESSALKAAIKRELQMHFIKTSFVWRFLVSVKNLIKGKKK